MPWGKVVAAVQSHDAEEEQGENSSGKKKKGEAEEPSHRRERDPRDKAALGGEAIFHSRFFVHWAYLADRDGFSCNSR